MTLPFTGEQFLQVFSRYNETVWPAQLALLGIALAAVLLLRRGTRGASRIACGLLALLWAWMAIAYHLAFFTRINPAAWVFGGAFLLASGAFTWIGVVRARIVLTPIGGAAPGMGGALIAYALIFYPLIGFLAGQRYPATPTFGLPCPTTIFTLGMLLFARPPVPWSVLAVPILWSGIGTVAAVHLGILQDLGLLLAAAAAAVALVRHSAMAAPDNLRPRT